MKDERGVQVVAIRFQPHGKLYHFDARRVPDLQLGDYVIVSTSRGREMGQIVQVYADAPEGQNGSRKPIERRATAQELVMRRMWQRRELEALIECRAKAAELEEDMVKIVTAEYSFDGSRLTYLYSSEGDEKIDLKDLRREMRKIYRTTQVNFRQIGPRDVAKVLGGMGACGLEERCCSRFMYEFSPISIKMAKSQGISLNPQEITGMCGRLRCCLVYEYQQYVDARKELPKRKKRVITPRGEGRVVDVLPLKQAVIVQFDDDRRVEFLKHEIKPYEEYKALEAKANEPCEKHGSGGCNCKRNE
jgi:cell fate regulator YaaT (PSP1 superfamily)